MHIAGIIVIFLISNIVSIYFGGFLTVLGLQSKPNGIARVFKRDEKYFVKFDITDERIKMNRIMVFDVKEETNERNES